MRTSRIEKQKTQSRALGFFVVQIQILVQEAEQVQTDDHDQRYTGEPKNNITCHFIILSMLDRRRC